MPPLRALLLALRLVLAGLALAGWVGPAAAMGRAMEVGGAQVAALHPGHHGGAEAAGSASLRHGSPTPPHDAKACCAAACGPVVAPLASPVAHVATERPRQGRPPADAFPPGVDPATAKPPPRSVSV